VTDHPQTTKEDARSLKDEVVAELEAWASELKAIEHEIEKTPWGTDEESRGYGDRASSVSDLAGRVRDGTIVTPLREGFERDRIHAEEPAESLPPAYRYEAFLHPPWETGATGGLVGYSDASEEDAALQLKLMLRDLLGDARADGLPVYGPDGNEIAPNETGLKP
jgi:hypothetical protein